jgi:hypothetical protein
MSLAVLLVTGPSLPRVTYLTRDWIHGLTTRVAGYLDEQSGGRVALEFRVFDWFRLPISDAEWDSLGWNLGDVARPLVEAGFGVDLSPFTHHAMIIDQYNSHLGAWAPGRPYLHLSAQDLTPALYAHELGHMFGARHSRRDEPYGPNEYGDAFCVMGAEGAKWSFPDPRSSFSSEFGQNQWRFCNQCHGLYYDGDRVQKGTCLGAVIPGTGHSPAGDNFVLPHDLPPAPEQPDWRRCGKCFLLFFDHDPDLSNCPAGGVHVAALASFNYALPHDVPPGPGQPDWRLCRKCRSMFFNGYEDKGKCAESDGHAADLPGLDFALPHDIGEHNASGPGMVASTLLGCNWLKLSQYGDDIGAPLRSRPGEVMVQLLPLRGAPQGEMPHPRVVAYADGLASDRLLIEYRVRDGWDRAMPDSSPGVGGWVLVHLTSGAHPNVTSLLVAQLSARIGAATFVRDAFLNVMLVGLAESTGSIHLRLRSEAWPALSGLEHKVMLPELSDRSPAIASDGRRLFLAWKGTDDHLNLMISEDNGATYAGKHTSGETSPHGPAVADCVAGVFVAWTGGGDGALNVAEVDFSEPSPATVLGLRNKVTLSETSPAGPAITGDHNGNIYLAWTGHDDKLNLVISGDRGATWPQKHTFTDSSSHGPAIISHAAGRLYLAWKGSDNENLNVARVHLELTGDPASPHIKGFAKKAILPDTSDHAPSLASHDGSLFLSWTGEGGNKLNLAGPVGETSGYRKHVFESESSDDGPALTGHRSQLVLAWRGSGNEHLNTAVVGARRRLFDDFTTGADSFIVAPAGQETRTQAGSMLGNRRMTRIQNPSADGGLAQADIAHGSLGLTLGADHDAELEIGYGWDVEGAGEGLALNLQEGGADRIRVTISHVGGLGVNLDVIIHTPRRMSAAGAFVGPGPTEIRFTDFAGNEVPDFTNVSHIQFKLRVVASQPGALAPNFPSLRVESIEARGPGEL